ncbi:MAG: hypothetical protein K2H45_12370 [Acetatifactor sp.]|nr:hypothetical protein [Acetatifactor sp.]
MKKIRKVLALGDLLLCLALVAVYGFTGGLKWQQTAVVKEVEEEEKEEKEIRKIALTFDDEVIIGLSQEICYKEAISMI